jgi:hypothetical protein
LLWKHRATRAVGPQGVNKFPLFVLTAVADNVDSFAVGGACHAGNAGSATG